jgi:hypothetical protein
VISPAGSAETDPAPPASEKTRSRVVVLTRDDGPAVWIRGAFEKLQVDSGFLAAGDRFPGPDEVLLVWGNAAWHRRRMKALAGTPRRSRPFVVVWHSEPLPLPPSSGFSQQRLHLRELVKIALRDERATDPWTNLRLLCWLATHGLPDLLVVTSQAAAETAALHGLRACVVPVGYDPVFGEDLGVERDIDVLFLGALEVPRRRQALRALRRQGLTVDVCGSWHDPRFWGVQRTELLNRTRIMLNIQRTRGQFSGFRLLLGMANGALVLSEPIYRPEPFVDGVHFVSGSLDEIPALAARYLDDERARLRVAEEGHAFVTSSLTLEQSLTSIRELAGV